MKGPVNTPGYVLPKATEDTLGGVKVGDNITVSGGTISVTKANVVNALGFEPLEGTTFETIPLPTQSGGLTYTGSAQSPTWSNYDSSKMVIVDGTTSATNAGTYPVSFAPKVGYCWSDGTTVAKSSSWYMEKKMPTHSYTMGTNVAHFIIKIYCETTANVDFSVTNSNCSIYGDTNWQGDAGSYSRTIYVSYSTNYGVITAYFTLAETSNYKGFTISGTYDGKTWTELTS